MIESESLPLELAYHSVTEPAILGLLEGLEVPGTNSRPPRQVDPKTAAHTVQSAAFHVMNSMDAMQKLRPMVQSPEEAQNYNATLESVHRSFAAVDDAARKRGIQVRPGDAPEDEAMARNLHIESLRISAMLERAEAAENAATRQAFLVTIREIDLSLREMIDDWRARWDLGPPMHEVPQLLGPEGEADVIEELRSSMPPGAADSIVKANQDAWRATPMRRRGMEIRTGEDLAHRVHVDEPPVLTWVDRFRDGNRGVSMAVLLPITPEYLTLDQRSEFILIIYEHMLHIVCQTDEDEYPPTVPNSLIAKHVREMLAWAAECEREHGEANATHPAVIRRAAARMLTDLLYRSDPGETTGPTELPN